MKTYTIERTNGDKRTATRMTEAIVTARQMLGVSRAYRGAEYQSDREVDYATERRENCTCLDIWRTLRDASEQSGACAPIVISW